MDSTLARPIQSYMKAALMYSLDRNCTCSSHYNCPFSSRSLPAKSMWSKSSYPKHFSILTLNYQKVQERKGQTLQCMIYICMPLENKPRTTIINITICLDFFLLLKSAPFLYLNLSHVIALLTFPLLPPWYVPSSIFPRWEIKSLFAPWGFPSKYQHCSVLVSRTASGGDILKCGDNLRACRELIFTMML